MLGRLWRRLVYGSPILVVSGLPRSGTSMIMQMLQAGGVEAATDQQRSADDDNPKGYFELEHVKTLEKGGDKNWLSQYRGQAVKIISYLLRSLPNNHFYLVIFIERNLDEVLASQKKMLARRGEESSIADDKMKENYRNHLLRTRAFLKHAPNIETLFLQHQTIIAAPQEQAERIAHFVGQKLDTQAMAQVVDAQLYRNRADANP